MSKKQYKPSSAKITPMNFGGSEVPLLNMNLGEGSTVRLGEVHNPFGLAVKINQPLRCPAISHALFEKLDQSDVQYVTRQIKGCYLEQWRQGYFHFGTLAGYRAKEQGVAGLLGDTQESRRQTEYFSPDGSYESATIGGLDFSAKAISGTGQQVVHETTINDYCSCSSIGKFRLKRGENIRRKETDLRQKLTAYVTYDLAKLRAALALEPELHGLTLLGRRVDYSQKDNFRQVFKNFTEPSSMDAVKDWMAIAYTKSRSYLHEGEYRLLAVDLQNPGQLLIDTPAIKILKSAAIAEAIFHSDEY